MGDALRDGMTALGQWRLLPIMANRQPGAAGYLRRPGQTAWVQLRFAEPLLLLPGDRFILRQFSPVVTIGGGVVVDAAHECMTTRGVHKRSVSMVTSRMIGTFRSDARTRSEFLSFIGISGAREI